MKTLIAVLIQKKWNLVEDNYCDRTLKDWCCSLLDRIFCSQKIRTGFWNLWNVPLIGCMFDLSIDLVIMMWCSMTRISVLVFRSYSVPALACSEYYTFVSSLPRKCIASF
ncbi:unnamed protein product [Linum tenue]|uniref:Uncharacterized protein n=1 Tax=Linum tenue TaxID=586396 RepID=A0AAV0INQ4_9ROSI|nr:unnamed protein product [Linum tenue]